MVFGGKAIPAVRDAIPAICEGVAAPLRLAF